MRYFPSLLAMLATSTAFPVFALNSVLVGSGFETPVFLTAPMGDARLFVVEKSGRIKVLQNGTVSTYLDISASVGTSGERGLLGLAFDPGFASNGRFYVDYIDKTTHATVVASYTAPSAASNTADPGSGRTLLTVPQPAGRDNHKAGWIGFRYTDDPSLPAQLYIATGDGGSGNDPDRYAQSTSSNLGKILRITPTPQAINPYMIPADNPYVSGVGGNPEVWALGLRNPYRNSFDRLSGNLWISDVGQDTREEINFQAAEALGGANYGWRPREGTGDNPAVSDPAPAGAIDPIFDYAHGPIGESVIGGYVYRGTGEPGLDGAYFFGDFVSGKIFTLNGGLASGFTDRTAQLGTPFGKFQLTSFGQDGVGNLYALGLNGNIYQIAAVVPEPRSWAMLAGGLLLLTFGVRRQLASAPHAGTKLARADL